MLPHHILLYKTLTECHTIATAAANRDDHYMPSMAIPY